MDAKASAGSSKPSLILLYAGKDAGALDAYLHAYNPAFLEYIWAVDIRRKGGDLGQDMLGEEPYSTMCSMAMAGKVALVGGAFKQRPLRDGGGKPSLGRLAPWARPRWEPRSVSSLGVALVGGWVTSLPGGPAGGHQGDSGAGGRASFLLDTRPPGPGARGPLGVTEPLTSPGIWPLKKELKGEEPESPNGQG